MCYVTQEFMQSRIEYDVFSRPLHQWRLSRNPYGEVC
nr:MAG TPA: hypothetical protein [Caudoviricetes sp.]